MEGLIKLFYIDDVKTLFKKLREIVGQLFWRGQPIGCTFYVQ